MMQHQLMRSFVFQLIDWISNSQLNFVDVCPIEEIAPANWITMFSVSFVQKFGLAKAVSSIKRAGVCSWLKVEVIWTAIRGYLPFIVLSKICLQYEVYTEMFQLKINQATENQISYHVISIHLKEEWVLFPDWKSSWKFKLKKKLLRRLWRRLWKRLKKGWK